MTFSPQILSELPRHLKSLVITANMNMVNRTFLLLINQISQNFMKYRLNVFL